MTGVTSMSESSWSTASTRGGERPGQKLEQQVTAAVQRRQRAGRAALEKLHGVGGERVLAAREDRRRPAEQRVELQDQLIPDGGVLVQPARRAGRGASRRSSSSRPRPPRGRARPPRSQSCGPVVDARQAVEVNVDHEGRSASRAAALDRARLGRRPGSRAVGRLARPGIAVLVSVLVGVSALLLDEVVDHDAEDPDVAAVGACRARAPPARGESRPP